MKISNGATATAFVCLVLATDACTPKPAPSTEPAPSAVPSPDAVSKTSETTTRASAARFPDFGFMVSPAEYHEKYANQPIFRLKTDFPREKPSKLPAFIEKIDFKKEPLAYIEAARAYSFDGNLPNWDPFANTKANWYHIPWLHPDLASYPPNGGTEGFHGLIKEAGMSPLQLGPDLKGKPGDYSIYAITLVNDLAGYTLGRMWADPEKPDPRATDARFGGGFPVGTVFAKLLFTDAPQGTDKVAYLENPLQWDAYITENFSLSAKRVVTKVNLLQMDLAIRDARADSPELTGWVFGTFVYNGQLNKPNKFDNLVPVGLMWGNDPEDRTNTTTPFPPTKTQVNPKLKQGVIFDGPTLPPQHLGWNGRLNGPADLNTTSCMSCHITAQYPQVTSLVPDGAVPDGGKTPPQPKSWDEWMKWFQNVRCATSMDPRSYSTDFSFQVAISLSNFYKAKEVAGLMASEYGPHAVANAAAEPAASASARTFLQGVPKALETDANKGIDLTAHHVVIARDGHRK